MYIDIIRFSHCVTMKPSCFCEVTNSAMRIRGGMTIGFWFLFLAFPVFIRKIYFSLLRQWLCRVVALYNHPIATDCFNFNSNLISEQKVAVCLYARHLFVVCYCLVSSRSEAKAVKLESIEKELKERRKEFSYLFYFSNGNKNFISTSTG